MKKLLGLLIIFGGGYLAYWLMGDMDMGIIGSIVAMAALALGGKFIVSE